MSDWFGLLRISWSTGRAERSRCLEPSYAGPSAAGPDPGWGDLLKYIPLTLNIWLGTQTCKMSQPLKLKTRKLTFDRC